MKMVYPSFVLLLAATAFGDFNAAAEQSATPPAANATKPAAKSSDPFSDAVVVKGKGLTITRGQLDTEFIRAKAAYSSSGQPAPPNLEQQVVDGLIGFQLLLAQATPEDKTAGKDLFSKNLQKAKEESKITDAEFNEKLGRQLLLQGVTKEQWEKQNIDQSTIQIVLKRVLNVNVSDAEVQKFYDDNPAKFEQPEMVRASHILLSTRDSATSTDLPDDKKAAKKKQAEDLIKRARAGEDFAKLAKEFSDDPGSKDKGGEYTFPRGQMVPEFEATAFSLKPNEVSDIVTTQFGYHIIKLSEKIPAKKEELAKVAPRVKEYLEQQAIQKKVQGYVNDLKRDAKIEILDDKLKMAADPLSVPANHPALKPASK